MLVLLTHDEKRLFDRRNDFVEGVIIGRILIARSIASRLRPVFQGECYSAKTAPLWIMDTAFETSPQEVSFDLTDRLTISIVFFHATEERKQWMVKFDKIAEPLPWDGEFFTRIS